MFPQELQSWAWHMLPGYPLPENGEPLCCSQMLCLGVSGTAQGQVPGYYILVACACALSVQSPLHKVLTMQDSASGPLQLIQGLVLVWSMALDIISLSVAVSSKNSFWKAIALCVLFGNLDQEFTVLSTRLRTHLSKCISHSPFLGTNVLESGCG